MPLQTPHPEGVILSAPPCDFALHLPRPLNYPVLSNFTHHRDCLREEGKQTRDPALFMLLDFSATFSAAVPHLHPAPVARNILRFGLIAFEACSLSIYHHSGLRRSCIRRVVDEHAHIHMPFLGVKIPSSSTLVSHSRSCFLHHIHVYIQLIYLGLG